MRFWTTERTSRLYRLTSNDAGSKKAKIYLTFGPFTGGVKSAGAMSSW